MDLRQPIDLRASDLAFDGSIKSQVVLVAPGWLTVVSAVIAAIITLLNLKLLWDVLLSRFA